MLNNIHPGIIFILIGLFAAMGNSKTRKMILSCCPFLALISIINTNIGTDLSVDLCGVLSFLDGYWIQYFYVDDLSWAFAFILCIIGTVAGIYGCHNKSSLEAFCSMAYVGSALGVVLAHDWLAFLFFWELEAATSLFLVWNDPRRESAGAGFRYIVIHIISGSALLFGVAMKIVSEDMLVQNLVAGPHDAAFWAILLSVCINVGVVPFHNWITDAYPSATLTGSIFMSSGTTKVAVYALIRIFGGTELLIAAGVIMALYGALYAVMENDMIKLLSYHIISQVGYMVCGAGIGTTMSMQGATAHAICDILFKSLLFMCCNALIYATGVRKINQLGGMAKRYPLICVCFIVGAFSIAGVPLFNGFVSKMITVTAAEEAHMELVALLLEVASIGTLLSICFKMLYFIFLAPDKGLAPEQRPVESNMNVAMVMGAVLCTLIGIFPKLTLYQFLPFGVVNYEPFTVARVTNQLIMMFVGVLPFLMFLPRMEPHTAVSLDFEWFYRRPIKSLLSGLTCLCIGLCTALGQAWGIGLKMSIDVCNNPMKFLDAKPFRQKKRYTPDNYRTSIADTIMIILTVLFICIFYFRTSY